MDHNEDDLLNDISLNDTIFLTSQPVNKNPEDESSSTTLNCNKNNNFNTNIEVEECNREKLPSILNLNTSLSSWGLPENILLKYKERGISTMFDWQVECLSNTKVLEQHYNLVYSAPTSAGKTLVAEILALKTLLERRKKVLVILPFVSVVREKMFYFQDILSTSGIRVEGFMGSHTPPGGFKSVQLAICTIEKANSIVNKLLEEGILNDLGTVIIDEMHLLGDPSRGYLLELLLTKLRYMSNRNQDINIQLIGMSATLPNLTLLAKWLNAELYTTNFRPIPLYEFSMVSGEMYDSSLKLLKTLQPHPDLNEDTDYILQLCLETINQSCSVLIFCPTKNWCENLAQQISVAFFKLGRSQSQIGKSLREQLNSEHIVELLEQLKRCPVGLDSVLKKTVSFGVAFHHAGLTMDERDIIEGAFRNCVLRVLVATSTLSSGVNLPAQRVIIRTPMFHGKPINSLTYRQMIGRAGRMGKDVSGESILICQKTDKRIATELMSAKLQPIESCLEGAGKLKRAILEVVASGVAITPDDVQLFTNCTLLAASINEDLSVNNPIEKAIEFLVINEFIRLQRNEQNELKYVATSLAKACLSSSLPPEEGLILFEEIEKARRCFVLDTDLHLLYLVTPYSVSNQWSNLDWMLYLDLWEKLTPSMKRVAELVGVRESYIFNSTRGKINTSTPKLYHTLQIHHRFYTALALQDLVNEIPLNVVANKFRCSRGMLQSLQQSASMFAGMVTSFCHQLRWKSVELLISQFQDRLQFGIQHELLDLMKLPALNGPRARALYNAGIETLTDLASFDICKLENVLHASIPFQSEKERDGETAHDVEQKKKLRGIWITGKQGLTARDAAHMLIKDARKYLQLEIGAAVMQWDQAGSSTYSTSSSYTSSFESQSSESVSKYTESTSSSEEKENVHCTQNGENNELVRDEVFENNNLTDKEFKHPTINTDEDKYLVIDNNKKVNDKTFITKVAVENKTHDTTLNSNNSLFEDSFCLDSKLCVLLDQSISSETENTDNKESPKSSNILNTSDIINTSQSEQSNYLYNSGRKMKRTPFKRYKENGNPADNTTEVTPRKRRKCLQKQIGECVSILNLETIDIIDVCKNLTLFETFQKEIETKFILSLSIACEHVQLEKPRIGQNVITGKEKKNELQNGILIGERLITGIALSCGANAIYYISFINTEFVNNDKKFKLIKTLISNKYLTLRIFDYKEQYKLLYKFLNIVLDCEVEDPKIADWLLEPEGKEKNLQAMALKYCPEAVDAAQLAGSCKGVGSVALDCKNAILSKIRASVEAIVTFHVIDSQKIIFETQDIQLLDTFKTEMKCISCLTQMELIGLRIDRNYMNQLVTTLQEQMTSFEREAFRLAGRHFSFTSSKDVAKILGIYKGKKISTNKQTLEQNENPIANIILQWRKLNCTLTKMLFPIIRSLITDRIFGSFITHSSTGRVTMHEPNLQNVPRNFQLIKYDKTIITLSVRSGFIPTNENIFLSADFCQLELRILAHLSHDSVLCSIMRTDEDIFKMIAAKLNKISDNQVTDPLRQRAKQLCYGIIYGIGSKALSEQLNSTEEEASEFMENFKCTYPKIKSYIKQVINLCREQGFVETLAKRRRYLSHINSESLTEKSQAERQAINTTIQGSAADIAKLAMIQTEDCLRKYSPLSNDNKSKVNLVLHLHDELIYEVPSNEFTSIAVMIKNTMEQSVRLSIPFPVKLKAGPSWGQLEEFNC